MQATPDELASVLCCCLSAERAERQRGEEALRRAASGRPGAFCLSLLHFIDASAPAASAHEAPPTLTAARLLAATQLKNQVLRCWRGKALDPAEKETLRSALLVQLGRAEPADAVGIALASAIAGVMRSESNRAEATVLVWLSRALHISGAPHPGPASPDVPNGGPLTAHALLTVLYTCKELRTMRLPAQRSLGRQLSEGLLPPLLDRWSAALLHLFRSGTAHSALSPDALDAALLHTKVVRQLTELAPRQCAFLDRGAAAIVSRAQEAGAALQDGGPTGGGGTPSVVQHRGVDRLGAALGKLVRAVCRACADGDDGAGAGGDACWEQAAAGAAAVILAEAVARREASARDEFTGGGSGFTADSHAFTSGGHAFTGDSHAFTGDSRAFTGGGHRRAREECSSAFAAQSAEALADFLSLPSDHPAVARWADGCERGAAFGGAVSVGGRTTGSLARTSGGGGSEAAGGGGGWAGWTCGAAGLRQLVDGLLVLMERPVEELEEWAADAGGYACAVLLPALEVEGLDGEDEGSADTPEEEEEEGSYGQKLDDEADVGRVGAAGGGGGGRAMRLRESAERALSCLIALLPSAAGSSLLGAMPVDTHAIAEGRRGAMGRDARYCGLGVCACEMQSHLGFRQVLRAAQSEAGALCASAAAGAGQPLLPVAVLQVRLCWLIPCWWAFGGSGDATEDAAACADAYALIATLLSNAADAAVVQHAAHALVAMLRVSADADLAAAAPVTPQLCAAVVARLGEAESDEALLWLLCALRQLLRVPAPVHPDLAPGLARLWELAVRERRDLLAAELRRCAACLQ